MPRTAPDTDQNARPDWVRHVMRTSFATYPPPGVFTRTPEEMADAGDLPGVAPLGLTSWQRMVLFHHNRGGSRLSDERKQALRQAIAILSQRRQERQQDPDAYDPGTLLPLAKKAAVRTAVGIPDRDVYGDLGQLAPRQLLDWIVQRHEARRAGTHYDVRFGNPQTGLYSWAVRKGLPAPGQRHLAVQQPLHAHSYKGFEGEISKGYGAGKVMKHDEGQILVTRSGPDGIHFTVAHRRFPERYALIPYRGQEGKGRQWLLINTTKTEAIPYEKQRYAKVPADKAEEVLGRLSPGSSVQAKLDGAASLTRLFKDHAEVVSYRAAKGSGHPIVHTERVAGGRLPVQIPRGLVGSVLRGELYGTDQGGQAIAPQHLGGLLNSSVARSLATQRDKGIKLRNMVFDVQQMGDRPVQTEPYAQRKAYLAELVKHLPQEYFHAPEEATTPADAMSLWQRVRSGQHPLTHEGVVVHRPQGVPQKIKLFDEHDVHIRDFFPGQGKYQGTAVGGFRYSHEPQSPIVGEVGTGFTDEMRRMMHEDPQSFVGRIAKVRAQERLPSGALRAPSFLGLHEDYPLAPTTKLASTALVRRIRAGTLSPTSIGRAASAMPQGSFRYIRSLGQGQLNIADLGVGNVGGQVGTMVRKLPTRVPQRPIGNLAGYYKPLVEESSRLESLAPGASARYFASTPKGVFQELADRHVYPEPNLWQKLKARIGSQGGDPVQVARQDYRTRMRNRMIDQGIVDLHEANFGPGGQILDFGSWRRREPVVTTEPTSWSIVPGLMTPSGLNRDAVRRYWLGVQSQQPAVAAAAKMAAEQSMVSLGLVKGGGDAHVVSGASGPADCHGGGDVLRAGAGCEDRPVAGGRCDGDPGVTGGDSDMDLPLDVGHTRGSILKVASLALSDMQSPIRGKICYAAAYYSSLKQGARDGDTDADRQGIGLSSLAGDPSLPDDVSPVVKSPRPAVPPVLRRLLAAKAKSDRGQYAAKHAIMRQLLRERPHEFMIDSQNPVILGLTHVPTGFRMHLPRHTIPTLDRPLSVRSVGVP